MKLVRLLCAVLAAGLLASPAFAQNTPPLIFGKGDPTHLSVTSNQDVFTGIYFPGPGQTCFAVAGVSIGCNPTGNGGGGSSIVGLSNALVYNNGGVGTGFALSGDCTFAVPAISCTKTGGVPFGVLATADPASPPGLGGVTAAPGRFSSLTDTGVTGIATNCLYADTNGLVHGTAAPCGGSGSAAFNNITAGTNTTAAMIVGTGSSITRSGSGGIDASLLLGNTWSSPGPIGATVPNSGIFTNLTAQNIAGTTQCVRASSIGVLSGTGADCNTPSFAGISGGTNTTANMIVGSGATLTLSGTGVINASTLLGSTWASPASIGATAPNPGKFSSLTDTAITGTAKNCVYADTNGLFHGEGVDCGAGGGSGTINTGTAAQVAVYPANGTTLSGATANGGCADLKVDTSALTMGVVFPVEATTSANYVLVAGDMGCTLPFTGGITVTLPSTGYGSTILAPGQAVILANVDTANVLNITNSTGGTMLPPISAIGPGEQLTLQAQDATHFLATVSGISTAKTNVFNQTFQPTLFGSPGLAGETLMLTEAGTNCFLYNTPQHVPGSAGGCGNTVDGHCGTLIDFTASTAVSVAINSLDPGCIVKILQGGTGTVTVNDTTVGSAINRCTHTTAQWDVMIIYALGGDQFTVRGDCA